MTVRDETLRDQTMRDETLRDQTMRDEAADDVPTEPCCPPVLGPQLDETEAHVLAERLKAVADPVRLQIINRLAPAVDGVCVCDLVEVLDRSQPTISHHLKILAAAGLVEREQRGRWAWYHLVESQMAQLRAALAPVVDASGVT